jgi:hypothetical protein
MPSPVTHRYGYPDTESYHKTLLYPADYFVPATQTIGLSSHKTNTVLCVALKAITISELERINNGAAADR